METAPRYVRERYLAMVQLFQGMARFTIDEVAHQLGRSVRSVYRYKARFKRDGVAGLFKRSTRPGSSPNKTPDALEAKILEVRRATGLGQEHIASLVGGVSGRTVHRVLARNGVVEDEPRETSEWRRFEWPRPNALIQADLTVYNGVPLLTCQDDHSRHAWAVPLANEEDETTYRAMKHILPSEFENLLTDNGHQFAKANPFMRQFRLDHVKRKHIHARVYHPQTLGKIGAFQKALKRFLRHVIGDDTDELPYWVRVFTDWYNAGRHHRGIRQVPDQRYHGQASPEANARFLEAFKLSTPAYPRAGD